MLQYKISKHDYLKAQEYLRKKNFRKKSFRYLSFLAGGIISFCAMGSIISIFKFYDINKEINFYELNWGIGLFLISILTFIIYLRVYKKIMISKLFLPDGISLSTHSVILSDNYLIIQVKNNEYKYYYEDLLSIELYDDLILIFIDNSAAIYIPVVAFESNEMMNQFVSTINKNIYQNKENIPDE